MPQIQYRDPSGQVVTTDLENAPPQVQTLYNQNYLQPKASLSQTQTSTAATAADIPGIQANAQKAQVAAQQAGALQGLKKDLNSKMTLGSAISKYTALGMSADDVFRNYLSQNTWGPNKTAAMPIETPEQLQGLGISKDALGDISTPGSFMNKYNTKNAIIELRGLQDTFNKTSALAHIPLLGEKFQEAYKAQATEVAKHLPSLIPGSDLGQASTQDFLSRIPDPSNPIKVSQANDTFNKLVEPLLQANGYTEKHLGLPDPPGQKTSTTGKDLLNGLLQTALPTAGAVGGGALGGLGGALIPGADLSGVPEVAGAIGGASVGGGAGQALADLLTGKKPGGDVVATGALSGVGEGAGAALGAVLGKVGGALANKVSDNVFNKVVSASPNYTTDITALKNTASKYGLMNGTTGQGLSQMPKIMSNIGDQIQTKLASVTKPVNLQEVTSNILKDFESKTNAFENTSDFNNAKKFITDRLYSATGNDNPLSAILNTSGNPMEKAGAKTTYSALYNLKSQVADDLKPVWKAEANPAATTNYTPKQEANLALWSGLKNEIDKADPGIRTLNNDQHNMFDIAKGFVKDANTGKNGSFAGDIFDTLAGNMLGGPTGALATLVGGKMVKSAAGKAILNKVLTSGIVQGGVKNLGAAAGGGLGGILGLNQ